jgi:hypothetical protein
VEAAKVQASSHTEALAPGNEVSNVRIIRVTYCAIFKQPIGKLNPTGMKFPVECPVEVFQNGDSWKLRNVGSRTVYDKLGHHPNAATAMATAEVNFETVVEPWQMWGTPPCSGQMAKEHKHVARMIEPHEVAILPTGVVCWKELEDFTHIIHAPTMDPKHKIPTAACGNQVDAKAFINNRANLEPTCKGCAEVWRKEYQRK